MEVDKSYKLIVIDANVFMHLWNPAFNISKHINKFLICIKDSHSLCIDSKKFITSEYDAVLGNKFKQTSDQGNELYILRFWMLMKEKYFLDKSPDKNLNLCLNNAIPKNSKDRKYAATALLGRCNLVTNDSTDLLDNIDSIKACGKKHGFINTEVITSQEAENKYCQTSHEQA